MQHTSGQSSLSITPVTCAQTYMHKQMIIQSSSIYFMWRNEQLTHKESRLHSERCSTAVQWSCFIFSIACVKPASPFLIWQRILNAVTPSLHRWTGWFTEERASLLLLPLGANDFCHLVVIECMDLQVMFHTLDLRNECSVEPFTRNMWFTVQKAEEDQAEMTLWKMSCCLSQAFIISEESCSVMEKCKPFFG